eukprot:12998534-Ditylum_brightwellii.AAC.1
MQHSWFGHDVEQKQLKGSTLETIKAAIETKSLICTLSTILLPFVAKIPKKKIGCDFFRPAMNLGKSIVIGKENAKKAFAQIEAGENVVFLANHQSEADPQ